MWGGTLTDLRLGSTGQCLPWVLTPGPRPSKDLQFLFIKSSQFYPGYQFSPARPCTFFLSFTKARPLQWAQVCLAHRQSNTDDGRARGVPAAPILEQTFPEGQAFPQPTHTCHKATIQKTICGPAQDSEDGLSVAKVPSTHFQLANVPITVGQSLEKSKSARTRGLEACETG